MPAVVSGHRARGRGPRVRRAEHRSASSSKWLCVRLPTRHPASLVLVALFLGVARRRDHRRDRAPQPSHPSRRAARSWPDCGPESDGGILTADWSGCSLRSRSRRRRKAHRAGRGEAPHRPAYPRRRAGVRQRRRRDRGRGVRRARRALPGPARQPARRRRAACTSSSTSTGTTTTSATSTGSTPSSPTATSLSILPAVAGRLRAGARVKLRRRPRADRQHAARRRARAVAEPGRPDLRQARGPEPGRLVEGPHRAEDDRARRGRRRAAAGRHDPRAVVGQHRHRARARRQAARLPRCAS